MRSPTPPRITSHKPPRPEGPPPGSKSSTLSSGAASGAAGSASATSTADASAAPKPAESTAETKTPATTSGNAAVHSGYLVKEGGARNFLGRRTWKRRWFVLDRGSMQYFETEAAWAAGRLPIHDDAIVMSEFTVVPAGAAAGEGADFALVPKDAAVAAARTWRFRGESSADVATWLRLLRAACSPA